MEEEEEGVELFVLLLPPRLEHPSLCKEPGAAPASRGWALAGPVSVCPTHTWSNPYLCVYLCVCT